MWILNDERCDVEVFLVHFARINTSIFENIMNFWSNYVGIN
jgi:hypothetical protein